MNARTAAPLALLTLLAGCPSDKEDGATVTVDGSVVTLEGEAIAGARVRIPGHDEQLTDAAGAFSISGVTPPYDVVAVATQDGWTYVAIYAGLGSTTPIVALEPQGTYRSADASGSLADFTAPTGAVTSAAACSPEVRGYTMNVNGAGAFSTVWPIGWQGPAQTTASFYALQFVPDGAALPETYGAVWGQGGVTLSDGGTASGLSLPRGLAADQTVTAAVSGLPSGYTLTYALPAVSFSPDCGIRLPELAAPASSFGYVAPAIDGATFQIAVEARNGAQDAVYAVAALGVGASTVDVTLPQGITISSPGIADTLSPSSPFAWVSGSTGVHVLDLYSGTNPLKVRVVTAGSSATLARLADVGVSLAAGVDYAWSVRTTPFATADEAATLSALQRLAQMRSLAAPYPVTAWAATNSRHNVAAD